MDPLIVFDFYTNLNEFYGVITECCTQQACPTMSAGQTYVSHFESVHAVDLLAIQAELHLDKPRPKKRQLGRSNLYRLRNDLDPEFTERRSYIPNQSWSVTLQILFFISMPKRDVSSRS